MIERGCYIVEEGSDGTGKSTQAILLDHYIRSLGYDTLRVMNDETGRIEPIQEPGGTERANKIRLKIKDKAIARTPWQNVEWFTDAREEIAHELILPALARGTWVITARNYFSTDVYQGYGEGIPIDEIEDYTRQRVGEEYMTPDLVVILALKSERLRRQRLLQRNQDEIKELDIFESKPVEFQRALQTGYTRLAERLNITPTSAEGSRTRVFRRVLKQVEPLLD